MNRGRGRSFHGGGGGGGGYGNARRTGPAPPTSESPPLKRDVQQPKPVYPLLPFHSGSMERPSKTIGPQFGQTYSDSVANDDDPENSELPLVFKAFDISLVKKATTVQYKAPLFAKNRERRKEDECLKNGPQHCSLRPGMVLLKNFLSRSDQIKILKLCRDLGVAQGGFQRPCYKNGATSQLMRMCFGKHWDHETCLYGDKRPTDGHVPPGIPAELTMLVDGAIQASHAFLKQKKKEEYPEDILPSMQPDVCIVTFYTNSGRLGLHQDKSETKESLDKGLPIVSFSIGDSAEFLYGDHRDVEKAEKVVLESGDVLIFGGMSRHIFHGVKCISPGTAPKTLIDDTNLRPGCLNLSFRKFLLSTLTMNRDRGSNFRRGGGGGGGGGGGSGYGNARRTGPAPSSESPLPKRDVQQPKPVSSSSTCPNGEPSVPACTGSKEVTSCIGSSFGDKTSESPSSPIEDSPLQQTGHVLPVHSGSKDRPSKNTGSQCGQTSSDIVASDGNSENSEPVFKPFDICLMKKATTVQLKAPLFTTNRERRKEDECLKNGPQHCSLRPGLVLLKNFLSRSDQIKIVKLCNNLGVGQGGFQKPGYKEGAQLQLMMMCLGKHWDPETGLYGVKRPTDGHVPPGIPGELTMLVKGAIQASHTFLKQKEKVKDPEDVLPSMQPDICIVNFYTNSGKLGLHQDKDEKESFDKGLPVVSFSIGDSAEFLYGDHRDVERAEKVVLESGDVLIFGGLSRRIFHGVKCISPGTAPKTLTDDTNLRPGRLNLTFRKY